MPKEWVEARMTICIDMNGVLDTYDSSKPHGEMYPPRPGVTEFLMKLKLYGYKVYVLTSCEAQDVCQWLFDNHLEEYVYDVTNEKVPALVYLDDRGITFNGNLADAFDAIVKFRTHWEDAEHHEGGNLE